MTEARAESEEALQRKRTASATHSVPAVVKNLVKHELSREQQLYYSSVTQAVLGESAELRSKALDSARVDPGLHPLLPYFAQFVVAQVCSRI